MKYDPILMVLCFYFASIVDNSRIAIGFWMLAFSFLISSPLTWYLYDKIDSALFYDILYRGVQPFLTYVPLLLFIAVVIG